MEFIGIDALSLSKGRARHKKSVPKPVGTRKVDILSQVCRVGLERDKFSHPDGG